ncbi:MAG: winged helix-turn-helix transcriptional regulator [Ruminococcaceae bacterium]|nr:winged helix-turn-helix transcriptional regulator [Oscillospiraceae bacterium]
MYWKTKNKEVKRLNKVQLLKEPGYIYDLNFIFCLKFNTQLYIDNLPNDNKKEENVKYFKEILNRFGDIPNDLYVFFHAIETGRAFLPTFYFNHYKNQFSTTYNFKYLQEELSDHNKLIRNLIKFYFHEFDNEAVEQCASSLNQAFSAVKNSDYSEEEKNKLYEFFIDPSRYIQLLQYELMQKEFMLSEYYKDNYQKIIDLYNQTTFESLHGDLKDFRDINIEDGSEIVYISYCLLNKFCISVWFLENGFLPLLGCEYMSILGYAKDISRDPDLYGFGTALCEESRVKILNFLIEREEVTCKDLEKEFSFSGSTAYHHINIMTKAGLVKTRNEGKTILYSLNRRYIANIINVLNKILDKKGK